MTGTPNPRRPRGPLAMMDDAIWFERTVALALAGVLGLALGRLW